MGGRKMRDSSIYFYSAQSGNNGTTVPVSSNYTIKTKNVVIAENINKQKKVRKIK